MNQVVRWQVVCEKPDELAAFCTDVLGWQIETDNALGYREVSGLNLPGGIWPAPPGVPAFTQIFVEVADLDTTLAAAQAAGAAVLVPKSVLPDGDAMAVISAPGGVPLGLCTLRR